MALKGFNPFLIVVYASAGNILGAVLNYYLGRFASAYIVNKFFEKRKNEINKGLERFKKYGTASLFFAWAPVVGDPLTIAAGILKINFFTFILLAGSGKILRYILIVYLTTG